jgi:hypothetical protein
MNDIKSVVSVIKILERTIGILENCNDVGEISASTRKRVIEMLNNATLEIYFLGDNSSGAKISKTDVKPEKEQVVETPKIEDVVENTDEIQPDAETLAEELTSEEDLTEVVAEEETLAEEEVVSEEETLAEEECISEEETLAEETLQEKEVVEEENIIENVFEESTVSEDVIFNQQDILSNKPLFEWEIDKSESVRKTDDDDINLLKLQLEEERKRLEQELQNWQDERRKRDEEILATKKLLESLQQQAILNQTQQQQPVAQQPQPTVPQSQPIVPQSRPTVQQSQPVVQPPVVQQPPVIQQPPVVQQSRPVVQPPRPATQQSATTEPLIRKDDSANQEAINDRFTGTKKVLHENFETANNNMVNQISTPVASLPRAIGINDRFRFIKELFGGDSDLYNDAIKKLDTIGSLVSAISYIESNFSWDKNSDSVKQLISLIRRRYM